MSEIVHSSPEIDLKKPPVSEQPLVSVVIPMRNEAANIKRCVMSIFEQSYPKERLEIVVVDGISDDGSRDVIKQLMETYSNVRCFDNPLKVTPRALNIGVQNSKGDVIIILGAHTKIKQDFIERNIEYMLTRNEVCTGGTQINVGDTYLQKAIGYGMTSKFGIPTAPYRHETKERYVDTVVYAAYKREILEEVGLFEEDIHISEDAELNWRIRQANHKIFFSPTIVSYYYPRPNLRKLFKQFFNYGLMRVNVVKKHVDAFRILHILPSIAVLSFLLLAGLSFLNPIFLFILLGLIGIYLGFNIVGSVETSVKNGWKYFPIMPFIFSTLHASFGIGFFIGLFKSQKWGGAIPKWAERFLLFVNDYIAINCAFAVWIFLRLKFGLFAETELSRVFLISNIISLFWFGAFLYSGLYRSWHAASRLDEFIQVAKSVFWGVFIIFLITFDLQRDISNPLPPSRLLIVTYLFILIGFVGFGRFVLHTFQRKLLELGVGLRRAIIVGWGTTAFDLFKKISQYPALGYCVVGFISPHSKKSKVTDYEGIPLLGKLSNIQNIIQNDKIEEIIIALEGDHRDEIYNVISATDGLPVSLKITPDLYGIITGQVRTNQIYGIPLIEILPQLMPAWEKRTKRLIDIVFSILVIVIGFPLWILIAFIIRLDSAGPIFYTQRRVGVDGKVFRMIKFRSMVKDAEKLSGPKWAEKNDPRITRVGNILRKLRLDEIPQFVNVLKGEMSLVGPRPERPHFVEQLKEEVPYYSRRLRIRPGITGWAQIKHEYDKSLDDVRKKLQYDIYYLENMSLRLDLKILLNTIYTVLTGKGH